MSRATLNRGEVSNIGPAPFRASQALTLARDRRFGKARRVWAVGDAPGRGLRVEVATSVAGSHRSPPVDPGIPAASNRAVARHVSCSYLKLYTNGLAYYSLPCYAIKLPIVTEIAIVCIP